MLWAKSVATNDLVSADAVGYGDCAENMILCPACSAAVFKACHPLSARREHFRHYASRGRHDCELRVLAIVSEKFHTLRPAVPRGQELEHHLTRFEAVIMAPYGGTAPGRPVIQSVNRMRLRPLWPKLIVAANVGFFGRWGGKYLSVVLGEIGFADWAETGNDVLRFLLGPAAERARVFAATYGVLMNTVLMESMPDAHEWQSINPATTRLLARGSNNELRDLLRDMVGRQKDEFLRHLSLALSQATLMFVLRLADKDQGRAYDPWLSPSVPQASGHEGVDTTA